MKNFYKVSNTIVDNPRMDRKRTVVGPMKDRVKSRISPINHRLWTVIAPMLFVAFGLFGVNESVWATDCNYTLNDAVLTKPHDWYRTVVFVGCYKINDFEIGYVNNEYGISHIQVSGEFSGFTSGAANQTFTLQYKIDNGDWQTLGSGVNIGKHKKGAAYTNIYNSDINIAGASGRKVYFKLKCDNPGVDFTDTKYPLVLNVAVRMKKSLPTSVANINFGDVTIGNTPDSTRTIVYSCEATGKTMGVTRKSGSTDFTASLSNENLDCSGTRTLTVRFAPSSEGSKSATFEVSSNNGANSVSFTVSGTGKPVVAPVYRWRDVETTSKDMSDSLFVEGSSLNLNTLWTSSNTTSVKVYKKIKFTQASGVHTGATEPAIDADGYTLSLGQAGVVELELAQDAATGYYAGKDTIRLTILRNPNTLYANSDTAYHPTMQMGKNLAVTLTATNTDYTNSPIQLVEQTVGDNTVAVFDYTQGTHSGTVHSKYKKDETATWSIHQDESYKYLEANNTFSVDVANAPEATDCYVLNEPSQRTSTQTFDLDARGKMLYIDFRRSLGDFASKIKIIGISSNGEEEIDSPSWDDNWTRGKNYDISSKDYTQIKVELSGGVNTKYYENLKVTRKTWLNASNVTIDNTGGTQPQPIYPSAGTGVGTLTIDYSIANGGDLKINNDNPKFTLSQTTISNVDCKTGSATINIQYNSDAAGTDVAHLVIYNDVYRKEVTITGITIKRDQVVNWEVGNVIRLGSEVEDAAWVITGNPVRYESSDSTKIDIVDGKLVAKGVGSAVITATADGSTDYYAASGTKTIEVTNDLIQSIVWTQDQDLLRMNTTTKTSLILDAYATSDVDECLTNGARQITYTSADESVVRIDGTNQLVVVGVGRTTVTATQDGSSTDADGHKYMTVSETKAVVVRDPNAPCINYQYVQEGEKSEDFGISLTNPKEKDVIKLTNIKEPDSLILRYRGESKHVGFDYYNGNMTVNEYYDGQWHIVEGGNLGTPPSDGSYGELKTRLNRKTTEVSVHVTQGRGYHKVTGMKIGVARYIEKTNNLTMFDAKVGQQLSQTLTIKYSNIVGPITLQLGHAQSNFSLSQAVINGECGDKDTKEITIYYTPSAATSHEEELLTISDGETSLQVTLEGRATVTDRYINWAVDEHVNVYTVDTVKLSAQSLATVGNTSVGSVYYVKDGTASTTGNISNDTLTFANAGVAKITALGVADPKYSTPVGVTRYYHAALTPTEVVEAPTIGSVVSGTALSDITVSGGTARNTINHGSVSGTFTVQNGNVTDVGPHRPVTVLFTPEDETMYATCTYNMDIEVTQRPATDEEIGTVTAGHITFGEKLSDAELSLSGTLNGHGTLVMTDPQKDEVKDVDTYENLKVLFTPDNTNIAPKELTVSVTVDKTNPAVTPQATDITYGQPISASNITTASGDVAGSWAWAVDDTQVLSVGDHVLKANFTSDSANYNNLSNVDVTLKVKKIATLEVEVPLSFCAGRSETFHGETYTTAGTDQINAVGATRDTVYNVTVTVLQPTTGTDSKTITVGDNESWHEIDLSSYAVGSHEVVFHTTNVAGCDSTVTLSLTVNKIETLNVPVALSFCAGGSETFHGETYTTAGTDQINAVGATRDTVYNVTVTVLQPTTGTDSKTITVGDNESWHEIDLSSYAVGSHEVVFHTTNVAGCDSTVTLSLTVNAVVPVGPNTFTGNGEWETPSNWSTGIVPTTAEPDIIVVGQLVINEEKTVGGLTIMPTGGVTIVDDGKLTVNGASADQSGYGDLYVKNGGEVEVAGSLIVRDLIVEASIGTSEGNAESGQVASAENIVYTNAYIDINMDPSGFMDDTKWYGFTVPFAVDAYNGVSRLEGTTYRQCGYGVHYMIAEYDANKRLNTGNGWKYISGNTLNAGQFYFFTVGDGSYNTYRFKASGNSYTPAAAASLNVNGPTTNYDANWNGVGNSTLQHVTASYYGGEYVQVFMNGQDAYKTVSTNDANFVVGCPFFIQAQVATTLLLSGKNTLVNKYYAPRRMQAEATAVSRINLSATDGGYSDQIYFSAVDKEQDAYIIGQDLSKAGESKVVPQLWMAQYNQKLSVHEAAWNGDRATCPLGIYVPKSGEFVLTATQPEDGTQIYLTENGAPIWDLTMSEYVLSLEKGNTSSYGLMIVRAPQVTTGVEDVQGAGAEVRKVIIDNTMYIITPEGTMFNAIGKKVQ